MVGGNNRWIEKEEEEEEEEAVSASHCMVVRSSYAILASVPLWPLAHLLGVPMLLVIACVFYGLGQSRLRKPGVFWWTFLIVVVGYLSYGLS